MESVYIYNVYLKTGNTSFVKAQRLESIKLLEEDMKSTDMDKLIIGGDFNFVTNHLDTSSQNEIANKKLSCEVDTKRWVEICRQLKIHDCFRKQSKIGRAYTKLTGGRVARRIDRFHSNDNIVNYAHIPISFSDHCASPGIIFQTSKTIRWGEGYWKLDSSLLDAHTVNRIKEIWTTFKAYDFNTTNIVEWWDKMKSRIKKYLVITGNRKK